jgi:cell division protein FtsZ
MAANAARAVVAAQRRRQAAVVQPAATSPAPLPQPGNPPEELVAPAPSAAAAPAEVQSPQSAAQAAAAKAAQNEFDFKQNTDDRGFFDKTEANVYNGEDLDVPTFLRKGIRIQL